MRGRLQSVLGNLHFLVTLIVRKNVANQNNQRVQAHVNANGGSAAVRVCDFVRMNPPEFLGSQTGEDPQNFLDEIKKIFEVIQVTGNDRVELASYQLKDVAHIWYTQWKDNMGTDAAPITWEGFSKSFLDRFFLIELREARAQEFMNLRQGNMTVQEYGLKFNQLSRYAPHMVADSRAQMNKFLYGVSDLVKTECRNAMLGDMNISRLMTHTQQHARAPSMDRRRTTVRPAGQVTDRGSCPWIDAPKAQLQSRLMVDEHGPSFDPRSVGSGSQHPDHA
ncbi:hypothetical protein MTR67_019016 [Solanum verrucosum]|uniref:Retrotransposon gag domain-containing protein n=1 Tax=Solanum verrucosum TaxID=315347 RepID=A0AAF0QRV3_SOLVR|nr:hypothetical protein MTR67_019016 [Solanum verrucosum]